MKKIIIIIILGSFFVFIINACNKPIQISQIKDQFTEEEVFKGIMFNEGKVASLIPQLQSNQIKPENLFDKAEDVQAVYDIRNNVLNIIKATYPDFLSKFKQEITSKNPQRIKAAYFDAAGKVYNSVLKLNHVFNKSDELQFKDKMKKVNKEFTILASDGTLNKSATAAKMKAMILESNNLSGNKLTKVDPNCILIIIVGVVAIVAVIAGVVVEAAAVTDTYAYVTDDEGDAFKGTVDNKAPLYIEELVGQIAVNL